MKRLAAAVTLALGFISTGHAANWIEGVNGDLSNSPGGAQSIVFDDGSNTVSGTSGATVLIPIDPPLYTVDRDYFRVSIGAGQSLTGITVLASAQTSFIAVQLDDGMFWNPGSGSPAGLLGWTHFGPGHVGMNILPDIGAADGPPPFPGADTFLPPLGQGNYVFLIQETGTLGDNIPVAYSLDFQFNAAVIPEPETYAMLLAGLGLLGFTARRRRLLNA